MDDRPSRSATRSRRAFGSVLLGPAEQDPSRLRFRIQLLLTLFLVSTNVIGAGIVFVLSVFVVPSPAPTRDMAYALAVAVPCYVGLAVLVGATWGTSATLKAQRWAIEGREPGPKDRRRALRAPRMLTLLQAALWILATILFTVLSLVVQEERALSTGLTVGIASIVVTTIAYLLAEFAMRPVAARALSGAVMKKPRGLGAATRVLMFWWLGTGAPVVGLVVVGILALSTDQLTLSELAVVTLVLGSVVLCFGFFVMWLTARAVVQPITGVTAAMREVERGEFGTTIEVFDGSELGMLQSGFNQMSTGLLERERLRDAFGRHVGRDVAEAALGEIRLGGETREVSVLFTDLVGSTTYAEQRDPDEVVGMLNDYFGVIIAEVDAHGGLVNKFMGDAVLAVFGAPRPLDDHPGQALAAARRIGERLETELVGVRAGIGVATGRAVAGYVGDESRYEFTVIGDAVNAASRLTELAKDVDGGVLADLQAVEAAGSEESAHWAPHGSTVLRGRSDETRTAVPRRASSTP
ncbi:MULTISPECIES: adenylate/guanylate cyclase domain-containing protein [unclassified Aeromicrobium]|uniref:adenylate/guanylate cyclase domain-containing protein n=1 Tax=unclassified Aeromicrobium TaxID=2633570 RepID=UPI00288981CC|nr:MULTISPECIES: adenylate/guanylate cyclase domain-containing protein [unclassified Aeromicrobium]